MNYVLLWHAKGGKIEARNGFARVRHAGAPHQGIQTREEISWHKVPPAFTASALNWARRTSPRFTSRRMADRPRA
jgi:hypothetical protein